MIIIRFFLRGDEEGTLHKDEFETRAAYDEWREVMGGSAELFSEEGAGEDE